MNFFSPRVAIKSVVQVCFRMISGILMRNVCCSGALHLPSSFSFQNRICLAFPGECFCDAGVSMFLKRKIAKTRKTIHLRFTRFDECVWKNVSLVVIFCATVPSCNSFHVENSVHLTVFYAPLSVPSRSRNASTLMSTATEMSKELIK